MLMTAFSNQGPVTAASAATWYGARTASTKATTLLTRIAVAAIGLTRICVPASVDFRGHSMIHVIDKKSKASCPYDSGFSKPAWERGYEAGQASVPVLPALLVGMICGAFIVGCIWIGVSAI